jgi:hypothetical protein
MQAKRQGNYKYKKKGKIKDTKKQAKMKILLKRQKEAVYVEPKANSFCMHLKFHAALQVTVRINTIITFMHFSVLYSKKSLPYISVAF